MEGEKPGKEPLTPPGAAKAPRSVTRTEGYARLPPAALRSQGTPLRSCPRARPAPAAHSARPRGGAGAGALPSPAHGARTRHALTVSAVAPLASRRRRPMSRRGGAGRSGLNSAAGQGGRWRGPEVRGGRWGRAGPVAGSGPQGNGARAGGRLEAGVPVPRLAPGTPAVSPRSRVYVSTTRPSLDLSVTGKIQLLGLRESWKQSGRKKGPLLCLLRRRKMSVIT